MHFALYTYRSSIPLISSTHNFGSFRFHVYFILNKFIILYYFTTISSCTLLYFTISLFYLWFSLWFFFLLYFIFCWFKLSLFFIWKTYEFLVSSFVLFLFLFLLNFFFFVDCRCSCCWFSLFLLLLLLCIKIACRFVSLPMIYHAVYLLWVL